MHFSAVYWIGLSSVLRPHQHSIGYMGDGFYRSKDPTKIMLISHGVPPLGGDKQGRGGKNKLFSS